ncbi:phosphoribosyltransferase [Mycolicibacterium houstonense]|uniref:phosphoribosyltransferase n=1 Tax=Mycolicibacterium houstonense TaxID=146021 RepID=UPI000831AE4D|nr:phosphoribosyltransferase [Mycolicibacterium houstonense]
MPANLTYNAAVKILGLERPAPPVANVLDFTDSYMSDVHDGDRLFERFQEAVPADLEYDTLVGTGLSGTIAVVDLARRLGKHYLVVRKANDNTHSVYSAEGRLGQRWLFVDDFIDTGRTLGRVYDKITDLTDGEFEAELVGIYEYKYGWFSPPTGQQAENSWAIESFHRLLTKWAKEYDGRYHRSKRPGAVSPAARAAEKDRLTMIALHSEWFD